MEDYFRAKAKLFEERLKIDGVAVVNIRDAWGAQIASALKARWRTIPRYRS